MSSLGSEDIEMGDAESDDEDAVESALGGSKIYSWALCRS